LQTIIWSLYLYNNVIMWSCPGNMPKYYSTKYHYRNLHEG